MKVALTTDHAGYEALKELKTYLESLGHMCVDYGPTKFNPADDYPDFIVPAAQAVASGECERAIIMGGSGQGEAMAANRVAGVRAAVFYGPVKAKAAIDADGHTSDDPYEIVRLSRQHNDANVLSLSGRFLTLEEMKTALRIWFQEPYSGLDRHARRIHKLDSSEVISTKLTSPRLQLAFLGAMTLMYTTTIAMVLFLYLGNQAYVGAGTWMYQLTTWALPFMYIGLGVSFVHGRAHGVRERLFLGSLLGMVGYFTFNAFTMLENVLRTHYRWFEPDYNNPSLWNAFGHDWILMLIGLTIFTGVLAILKSKEGRK